MSIAERLGGPFVGSERGSNSGSEVQADRGFGGREALAAMVVLTAVLVLLSTNLRWLVPIGAPGSTLPRWILGPIASLGNHDLPIAGPIAAASFGLLTLGWLLVLRDAESLPLRAVMWAIGVIYAMLLIAPPLLSTDVFTYLSAGRLEVLHGINPYLHGPVVKPEDPVFGWTGLVWCDTPTVYGPIFSLISAALANSSLAFGLWTLKLVAALSALACAALTWSIAKAIGRPAMPAMLFVALNPVLLVHGIGGGHNDLLMLAAVLLAVRLAVGARPMAAGGVLASAVAIKATAGLVLPIGAGRRADRGARRAAAGFAAVFVTIGAVGTLVYGFSWLRIPSTIANGVSRNAGELSSIPGMIAGYGRLGELGAPARIVLGVGALICLIAAVRFALKGGDRWIAGAGFAVLAAMVFTSQLHPWYIVLVLPFAALSDDRRVKGGAIALTIAVLLAIPLIRHLSPIGYAWPYGA